MSECITPYALNGSYGQKSREGQYEKLYRLYERLNSAIADPDARPSSLERVREEMVTQVADMEIPFDDALQLLRQIGVASEIPDEAVWLEMLGLGTGVAIRYGGGKERTILDAGMTLNKMAGPDVKPYAWFTTRNGLEIVGVRFARDGPSLGMSVKRPVEVASTTDDHARSV